LYVPLNTAVTYDDTKPFARAVAERMEREHPNRVVSKMEKRLRVGKVLVDWSQNDRHKTTVCVYSLRAKERPTASTPITWDEVRQAVKNKKSDQLSFLWDAALERVEKHGDLFAPVLKLKQKLPKKLN
jgi:bifunctional non-homologous end joining protein LigD